MGSLNIWNQQDTGKNGFDKTQTPYWLQLGDAAYANKTM
jgi:hypothetical protein